MNTKKTYFASDLHLGVPDEISSRERELKFIEWLNYIQPQADALYLLGDVFDFWFEYKKAIPKGHVRIQAKLAQFTDMGIPVHFFPGNHDMWINDYFQKELGLNVCLKPCVVEIHGKQIFLGHGDGLGPGEKGYKFLKEIFKNSFLKWSFSKIHPNTGISLAEYLSRRSRARNSQFDKQDFGENEFLLLFSKNYAAKNAAVSHFIFGHRHLPIQKEFEPGKFYINLGDWISNNSFLEADQNGLRLCRFHPGNAATVSLIE